MMIEKLKNIIENGQIGHQTDVLEFINYLDEHFEKCKSKLIEVKNKYHFDSIHKYFPGAVGDIHLEFVTGTSFDTGTKVCLNNGGNVDDDKELGVIIEEIPSKLIEKNWKKNYDILERLYYTWLANAWQAIRGYECELKVRIIDGGGSQEFSLNDYTWFMMSDFFDWKEVSHRVKNIFKRNLEFEEIFLRTGLPKSIRDFKNGYLGEFVKDDQVKSLMMINNIILEKEGKHEEINMNEDVQKLTSYETAKKFSRRTIELMNDNWIQKMGIKIIK